MGLDEDAKVTFLATVERYNELAENGVDEDFGKAAYRMSTVSEPPFFAARIAGTLLCSIRGILTDANSRALKTDGTTVDGLWACGNDQGGFYPKNYPSQLIGMNMAAYAPSPASPSRTRWAWSRQTQRQVLSDK